MYAFKCYQQIAIKLNVGLSWPHFSWPTRYMIDYYVTLHFCL